MNLKLFFLLGLTLSLVVFLYIKHCDSHRYGSVHDLREAIGRQLEYDQSFHERSVEVVASKDVADALRLFDAYIIPTLDKQSERRVDRLKRQIVEGRSWMYRGAAEGCSIYYLINLFPSFYDSRYGFSFIIGCWDDASGACMQGNEDGGLLELMPQKNVSGVLYPVSAYEEFCQKLPRVKDGLPSINECCHYSSFENVGNIAVVDVIDVQLVNVSRLDYMHRHSDCIEGCVAAYCVRMDVRAVERGAFPSDIFILETRRRWHEFAYEREWLYYRGMCLRVGVIERDGDYVLVIEQPVCPYSPYSDVVSIAGGGLIESSGNNGAAYKLNPLQVQYERKCRVEFCPGDLIAVGNRGSFVDFGVTSKARIQELDDSLNIDHWRGAWFIDENDRLYRNEH